MTCMHCDRDFHRCICEDFEQRLAELRQSPFLDSAMLDTVAAEHHLAKFEIDADREQSKRQSS